MASEKPSSITLPPPTTSGRHVSPSPQGLRQRPLGRASTFAEGHPASALNRRRSSFLSETLSETRKSFRSSTDDILLPRAKDEDGFHDHDDSSHWQSLPLGLALLPAVGGLFFKNGSAVITDVTLLGLAAIFMNWALRSPWDWYRAAQTPVLMDSAMPTVFTPIDEVDEDQDPLANVGEDGAAKDRPNTSSSSAKPINADAAAAQKELRIYELLALLSCFVFPLIAAWLLHSIRSQLSRPSEGLVCNYNLSIFVLVAEIRPISHSIKMVQRRTLFLQRRANMDFLKESSRADSQQFRDLSHRLNELEAHVADRAANSSGKQNNEQVNSEVLAAKASATATSEVKRSVQPELDALSRAMRRYEKRSTISSVQIEARLQDLEARLNDVVSLAAAAQRNADRIPNNYIVILTNWACAVVVLPVQYMAYLASLPPKVWASLVAVPKRYLIGRSKVAAAKETRASRKGVTARPGEREKRSKMPP